jgi:hypothetical protein
MTVTADLDTASRLARRRRSALVGAPLDATEQTLTRFLLYRPLLLLSPAR